MGINDSKIRRIIREQEAYVYRQKFPWELKAYLYDTYGDNPWPYEFSKEDIYSGIKADARAYFMGKLDVTLKPPLQNAQEEIGYLRELYGDVMCENRNLQNYIDGLHELLWANRLGGSRMLHDTLSSNPANSRT